tara:strand:+ start:325 stop:774 length:450 start_codon:yes stop_codon:yes gene_type:complete
MGQFKETKATKCCGKCPFTRGMPDTMESLGGSNPLVYIGQTRGPFWLPCHQSKNYIGKGSDPSIVDQCRGAAIFRANCKNDYKRPEALLTLPEDKERVFADESEFFSHYSGMSINSARSLLTEPVLDIIMNKEIHGQSSTKRFFKTEEK